MNIKNCLNCGEKLKMRYDREVMFCSRKCHYNYKSFIVPCGACGKELRVPNCEKIYRFHFCSRECMSSSQEFTMWRHSQMENPSYFKVGNKINKGKHLSPKTEFKSGDLNPNWKGGTNRYRGEDWEIQKNLALDRDGFSCVRCGSKTDLCVHHKKPWIDSKDNTLDNLMVLCRSCHIVVERGYGGYADDEGIVLKHISVQLINEFIDYANSEFEGSRGAAFQAIWSYFKHDQKDMLILERLIDLKYRVDKLESNQSDKKTVKMLDGRTEVKR